MSVKGWVCTICGKCNLITAKHLGSVMYCRGCNRPGTVVDNVEDQELSAWAADQQRKIIAEKLAARRRNV